MYVFERLLSPLRRQQAAVGILLCAATGIGAFVIEYRRPSPPFRVPDVRLAWGHTFHDYIHTLDSGALSVHVQGRLDGEASLLTSDGEIPLHSGPIDKVLISDEYYGTQCRVEYEPCGVRAGDLSLRVEIGCHAESQHLENETPVNYTGWWRTRYPNGGGPFSEGFWRHNRRIGKWTYWNKDGTVDRVEDWGDETREAIPLIQQPSDQKTLEP